MVSLPTVIAGSSLLLSYFLLKHQTLESGGDLQEKIEKRLQPKYDITEPKYPQIFSHIEWPSEEFYFEAWHVEVVETRWMKWRKWLPRGKFRGSTIIQYKIYGQEAPPQDKLHRHRLATQPYVRSIEKNRSDPHRVKIIYESVDPSNISTFAKQFRHMLRETTFEALNPDVDIRYETITDKDGNKYVRIFDANKYEEIGSEYLTSESKFEEEQKAE